MELPVEHALQRAISAHKEGKLQDAERLYRAILQSQPVHPVANHNLGVMAVSVNKADAALPLFATALEASPEIEQFWQSYIDALIREKKFENAKQLIERAKNQGVAEEKINSLEARLLSRTQIENLNSVSPSQQQLSSLLEHYQAGRLDDAERLATAITHEFPIHIFSWKILGAILGATGRYSEAVNANQTTVALSPQDAAAHYNLGNTLRKLGRLEEAEASYREAIALTTGFTVAHQKLAITLRGLGKTEQAIQSERFSKFLIPPNIEVGQTEDCSDDLLFKKPSPIEYPALYRVGMGTENVGGFLRAMAQMLRPKNILEIGAGYTTPFLLEALANNERVYDDGNLEPSYFEDYAYDSKLVVIDNMSLGELSKKPGMDQIISSKYIEFVEGNFEGKAEELGQKYGDFDFVWYDAGGLAELQIFMDEYWDICSDYIFFHFTYSNGSPNKLRDIILNNATGNPSIFDIVEPHKKRQGSITMMQKK